MNQPEAAERWLALLLRIVGGICLLALIPLWMPHRWIETCHQWLGLGIFPDAPIADYLARRESAVSAFYGGLLIALSFNVRRYIPLIRYQAVTVMALSVCGLVFGTWAGMPLWLLAGDAAAFWLYCVPILVLAARVERGGAKT